MASPLLLGSHMSTSGGLHRAFERAGQIGCTTMQIFVKNSNQWTAKAFTEGDVANYKTAAAKSSIAPVVAHAAYLINLCAQNVQTLKKSREALVDELSRCETLGVRCLIIHPGAHVGAGEEEGIKRIAESVNLCHRQTPGFNVLTTLEGTAGQGTTLGYRFEQLRKMLELIEDRRRTAVCLDTCHLFAAGHDIGTPEGWDAMMRKFDDIIGLEKLAALHVNDSKRECGSRIDRHEHIGKGMIGLEGFRAMMNDRRLDGIPRILETEKSEDMHEDVENMRILKSLLFAG